MRNRFRCNPGFAAFLAFLPLLGRAGEEGAVIESIDAEGELNKIVVVITASGKKNAGPGTQVGFGDRVRTGPRATAKLRFKDGSKLLIGKATEIEVQDGMGKTQWNELVDGEVRGIIKKSNDPRKTNSAPRFGIRTRSVVMGVRGTDFVFNTNQAHAQSEIRTLEGTVEVAKDEASLLEGRGTAVRGGELVHATPQGIGPVESFDPNEYYKALETTQPGFVKLAREEEQVNPASRAGGPEAEKPPVPAEPTPDAFSEPQQPVEQKPERARLGFWEFRLAGLYVRQLESNDELKTGKITWNPRLRIFGPFSAKLNIGGFLGKVTHPPLDYGGEPYGDTFFGFQWGALGSITLGTLEIEAGVGAEEWKGGHSRVSPMVMGNVSLLAEPGKTLDRCFVGVAFVDRNLTQRNPHLEIQAGIGVALQ